MNMILDATPVPFVNPFNQAFEMMPLAMVNAYVPYASHLNLEEAAKVAAIRDTDEANITTQYRTSQLVLCDLRGCTPMNSA